MTTGARIRAYYQLTKPGIIRGNLITAAAGFFLAAQGDIDWQLGGAVLLGLGLIIASACVTNNFLDRGIDAKMARTANRALVSGLVSGRSALLFATALGIAGSVVLELETTLTALLTAIIGWIAYVIVYGYYKRRSTLSTAVGSISGAIPPVVGYTAVTNQLDGAAIILFLILTFWQMPHFFAIAIYRLKDYASASLPVLPVAKGVATTRRQMVVYLAGYATASLALTVYGYTGILYAVVMLAICSWWLFVTLKRPLSEDATKWGKQVFLASLVAISVQCVLISFDATFDFV